MRPYSPSQYGGPYRSRRGLIFGVCRGLAEHFDFSVFWMRVICIVTFIVSGFFPVVIAYIAAAVLMKRAPAVSWCAQSYTPSGLGRLRSTFDSLDRRIQRIESIVTDREYDWDQRLRSGQPAGTQ